MKLISQSVPSVVDTESDPQAARDHATWAAGDFAKIGVTLQLVGEHLCEAAPIGPGVWVLDVAAGNGNAALAAARRGANVVATDLVEALLVGASARAAAEGLPVEIQAANAEALPFAGESFDAVVSTFGVMFAARQQRAAAELLRVCRPGGVIALANWTPEGFIGELLRTVARHVPPPADRASPLRWGDPRFLTQIFGDAATITHLRRRDFVFRYASAEAFVDFFREWYGPTHRAFAALPPEARPALAADVATLARKYDRSTAPWLEAHGEYLEVVLQRAG